MPWPSFAVRENARIVTNHVSLGVSMLSFTRLLKVGYAGVLLLGVLVVLPLSNLSAQFRPSGGIPVQASVPPCRAPNVTSGLIQGQLGSIGGVGSIGNIGSIGSIGSTGSIGTNGSIGSIGSIGTIGTIGGGIGTIGTIGG